MKIESIKTISKDSLYTVLSNGAIIFATQIVTYPVLAAHLSPGVYGTVLSTLGIVDIVVMTLGTNLCDARLICNKEYSSTADASGDFWIIALANCCIACILVALVCGFAGVDSVDLFFTCVYSALCVIQAYCMAYFRLTLSFKKNLVACLFRSLGLVVGILLFLVGAPWATPFLASEILTLLYIWFRAPGFSFSPKRSQRLPSSVKSYLFVSIGSLSTNITSMFDRVFLLPTLGSVSVSLYSVASFFGKSVSLFSTPMGTLVLSYLSTGRIRMTMKRAVGINLAILLLCMIVMLISAVFGQFITGLFYPTLIDEARQYILLGNVAAIVGIAASLNGRIVLACVPAYWQSVLSISRLALYCVLGLALASFAGLQGYCAAILVCNIVYFAANTTLCLYYVRKETERIRA